MNGEVKNHRLFDRILGTWHGDREMSQFFEYISRGTTY